MLCRAEYSTKFPKFSINPIFCPWEEFGWYALSFFRLTYSLIDDFHCVINCMKNHSYLISLRQSLCRPSSVEFCDTRTMILRLRPSPRNHETLLLGNSHWSESSHSEHQPVFAAQDSTILFLQNHFRVASTYYDWCLPQISPVQYEISVFFHENCWNSH